MGWFQTQKSLQFWSGGSWVAVVDSGGVGAISGVDWLWNGGVCIAGCSVDLGDKLGVNWKAVMAWFQWKGRGGRGLNFAKAEGRIGGGSRSLDALSLRLTKVIEERKRCRF